jgi:thiamine kinase-like enzyme
MDKGGIEQYLTSRGVSFKEIIPVTDGGAVNYIWRVIQIDSDGTSTSTIIKNASHHLRMNHNFQVSLDRMDFEAKALTTLPDLLSSHKINHMGLDIRLPTILHHDVSQHILHLSDDGFQNLLRAYTTSPALNIDSIGSRLGLWLAYLHTFTSSQAILPLIKAQFNNLTGKKLYRTNFNGLAAALEKFGHDPKLGDRMNSRFGSLLETDEACLVQGDFWPGNVVVKEDQNTSKSPILTVIDWEMVRIGNGATDVAQFAAEAWILETFRAPPERRAHNGLMASFLKTYLAERTFSDQDKLRMAAQFAAHIVYLPSVVKSLAERPQQQMKMVRTGKEILDMIDREDLASLRKSVVEQLFDDLSKEQVKR